MFDFLSSPTPHENDPSADDVTVRPAEASTSAILAAEPPAVASDEAEETLADSAPPAELASEETEAPNDPDEEQPPDPATPKKAPTVVPKAATGEEEVIDLPDFSHEPTEPGQYTLRIVFTFRPGDQNVILSTQSHDVLAIVGELEPTGARALLAPFIAAHEGRLGEIKAALSKPAAKAPARSTGARSHAARNTAPQETTATKAAARLAAAKKKSPTQKDKAAKTAQPTPPAALPQTNLFPD